MSGVPDTVHSRGDRLRLCRDPDCDPAMIPAGLPAPQKSEVEIEIEIESHPFPRPPNVKSKNLN
jgi:hypothetical protein